MFFAPIPGGERMAEFEEPAARGQRSGVSRRMALKTGIGGLALLGGAPSHAGLAIDAGSPEARGFDFLYGAWNVVHRKLRKRLAGDTAWYSFPGTLDVTPILDGRGNVDINVLQDPKGTYEASSLRMFNATAGTWSIWWLDGRAPAAIDPPVIGRFDGAKGTFYSDDVFEGRPIRVRTTYEPHSATRAQWTQAFSNDGGTTWEVNWIMDFQRRFAKP
jgi:hypothetical protein